MTRSVAIECSSTRCIRRGCIVRTDTVCQPTRRHTTSIAHRWSSTGAPRVAAFSTRLQGQHCRGYAIGARKSSSFYVDSAKAFRRNRSPKSSVPTASTFWNFVIAFRTLPSNAFPPSGVSDPVTEADEMYQNAGEKGMPHLDPEDPPRRRANKFNGHGTFANDRPPLVGVIGRTTGAVALEMVEDSTRKTLETFVVEKTQRDAVVNTDEWPAYKHLSETGRTHWTVRHGRKRSRPYGQRVSSHGHAMAQARVAQYRTRTHSARRRETRACFASAADTTAAP